jgi:hypothetical protein
MHLEPYIIPAMGSHGGATADGQAQVLAELGITEETVRAPIVSNMDVVSMGHIESGAEVFFAKDALAADQMSSPGCVRFWLLAAAGKKVRRICINMIWRIPLYRLPG